MRIPYIYPAVWPSDPGGEEWEFCAFEGLVFQSCPIKAEGEWERLLCCCLRRSGGQEPVVCKLILASLTTAWLTGHLKVLLHHVILLMGISIHPVSHTSIDMQYTPCVSSTIDIHAAERPGTCEACVFSVSVWCLLSGPEHWDMWGKGVYIYGCRMPSIRASTLGRNAALKVKIPPLEHFPSFQLMWSPQPVSNELKQICPKRTNTHTHTHTLQTNTTILLHVIKHYYLAYNM